MDARRIRLLLTREFTRASVLAFVGGYLAASAAMGLVMAGLYNQEGYLQAVYLWFPLVFAPWAARLVTRDRDRGFAAVLATTPLRRAEELAARLLFLALFVLATLAATLPVTVAVWPERLFLVRALDYYAWGFYMGWSSSLVGLLVGHLFPTNRTFAMVVSTLTIVLGQIVSSLAGVLVKSGWGVPFPTLPLLHLLPVLWPMEAMDVVVGYRLALTRGSAWFGAVLTLVLLAAVLGLLISLQDADGWRRPGRRQAGVLVVTCLVAAGAFGGLAVAIPDIASASETPDWRNTIAIQGDAWNVTILTQNDAGEPIGRLGKHVPYADIASGDHVHVVLRFTGDPGGSVPIGGLTFSSEQATIQALETVPPEARLDTSGRATVDVPLEAVPHFLGNPAALVHVEGLIDGTPIDVHRLFVFGDWDEFHMTNVRSPVGVAAAGIGPAAAMFALAVVLPRRLNRW